MSTALIMLVQVVNDFDCSVWYLEARSWEHYAFIQHYLVKLKHVTHNFTLEQLLKRF